MSLLAAPLWIQVLVAAEAVAIGWLAWRFAWRGLLSGALAAVAFWFLLGLGASFLVSRLEGGGATPLSDLLAGAVIGAGRAALFGLPLVSAAALIGLLLRRLSRPKRT